MGGWHRPLAPPSAALHRSVCKAFEKSLYLLSSSSSPLRPLLSLFLFSNGAPWTAARMTEWQPAASGAAGSGDGGKERSRKRERVSGNGRSRPREGGGVRRGKKLVLIFYTSKQSRQKVNLVDDVGSVCTVKQQQLTHLEDPSFC